MRQDNGTPITQKEFARRVEISDGALRAILAGGGTTTKTAVKIIQHTDGLVTLSDLLPRTNPRSGT